MRTSAPNAQITFHVRTNGDDTTHARSALHANAFHARGFLPVGPTRFLHVHEMHARRPNSTHMYMCLQFPCMHTYFSFSMFPIFCFYEIPSPGVSLLGGEMWG